MTEYRVQMMTAQDYREFLSGSNNYSIRENQLTADNANEALVVAKKRYPEMVINSSIKSLAEIEEEEKEAERNIEEANKKEAEKKAKREASKRRREERDLANGITPEMRKAMTYAKRYASQIEELERQLKELNEKKAYWEAKARG